MAIVVGSRLLFSYAQQPAPSVCCCPCSGFYLDPPVLPSQVHSSWPPSTSSSTPKVLMRQYGRWRRRLWLTCPHHRGNACKAECLFLNLLLSAPPWGYYITTLRECFDFVYPGPCFCVPERCTDNIQSFARPRRQNSPIIEAPRGLFRGAQLLNGAERKGFEPLVTFLPRSISSRVP